MFDLSSKFNSFYEECVVLRQDDQNELYKLKNLNIQRVKEGLNEYNEEYGTSFAVVDDCVQGSVAMATVVQNEDKDYDIDVAIVFDKEVLGDKGARATRNMVADALRRKTKQFNTDPEVKTSCVRVKYAEGYHIDFAVYRRGWDEKNACWMYEHAGNDWETRELRAMSEWFNEENENSDKKLRRVIRLSKMFCNSRESWKNMPSGLLQTVLCDERLQDSYDRIDELFYYTMRCVVDRLEEYVTVEAPVDNGRDLTPRDIDKQRMINWKNRLKSKLDDLEILFCEDCTKNDALQAWYGFFNHEYWEQQIVAEGYSQDIVAKSAIRKYDETEQFIEELYPVQNKYGCVVSCVVRGNGFRERSISEYSAILNKFVPRNMSIRCKMERTDCPSPYKVLWKVKNVGPEAERRNEVRGQVESRGNAIRENTLFRGNHYIECYIVKNDVCVAQKRISVPIGKL